MMIGEIRSFNPTGFPSPASDYEEEKLDLYKFLNGNSPATFFAWAEGDPVEVKIGQGDLLVVDRTQIPRDGKVIVCHWNGEHIVKRLRIAGDGRIELISVSSNTPPIMVRDLDELRVFGVVVFIVHQP